MWYRNRSTTNLTCMFHGNFNLVAPGSRRRWQHLADADVCNRQSDMVCGKLGCVRCGDALQVTEIGIAMVKTISDSSAEYRLMKGGDSRNDRHIVGSLS
jgi:hypothetical protein